MFGKNRSPQPGLTRDIRDEVLSMCRSYQIRNLDMPKRIKRDLGLDCGCDGMSLPVLPPRIL